MAKTDDLLSTGKWADKLGVSAAKIKKAIIELNIEPDQKKGNCAYYSSETMDKVKKAL